MVTLDIPVNGDALAAGEEPKFAIDWLPAVEALALNGDFENADRLVEQTIAEEANRPFVCSRLSRLADQINTNSLAALQQRAGCK